MPWAGFVVGFERAAAVFDDNTLRFAALKMFEMGQLRQPQGLQYGDVSDVFRLGFVLNYTNESVTATAAPPASATILTRQIPGQIGGYEAGANTEGSSSFSYSVSSPLSAADKLIIRTGHAGWADNSAFILSDLFGGHLPTPPHAHENQHGQINWYEFAQTPLVSSLGYDNRGPAGEVQIVTRSMRRFFCLKLLARVCL
jgi:hypothetical protein